MSVHLLMAELGWWVMGGGGCAVEHTGARMQMRCVKEGVFMWKKVRIGMSCMEGALFIYRYRRPRLCICPDGFIVLSVSTEALTFIYFFHTVQPEVCLSADKELLHTSIVFFNNPPAPQTSPPCSFYGCPEDWKENLQLAAHQHAKHGMALDLAK